MNRPLYTPQKYHPQLRSVVVCPLKTMATKRRANNNPNFCLEPDQTYQKRKKIELLNEIHYVKRLIIPERDIYDEGQIPENENDLLFVYVMKKVNPDWKETLDFENKCIKEADLNWVNYSETAGSDLNIKSLCLLP